ncbi:hypothetical protein ACLOJK_015704 [Asimina triloba]
MADYDGRYDGDVDDPKSQQSSREYERDSGKSKDKKREKDRHGDKDRDHDRNRHHRDRYKDKNDRRERGRDRGTEIMTGKGMSDAGTDPDLVLLLIQGVDHIIGQSLLLVHKQKATSLRSKRISGFDMAPSASATMFDTATAGQLAGPDPAIPGMINMFTMPAGQATRHARRVYVGGLPPASNEQAMAAIGGNTAGAGDAVVNVYINHEKKFAFVEMRTVEEASNAMALDGIIFEGAPVKVRRPSDYKISEAARLGPSQPNPNLNLAAVGLTPGSAGGLEGPDRIFVGGLPYYFTEAQVRELLESFGPLWGFDLVKDRETGNSKGYAFCVYHDISVTDIACAALNGIKMGDKTLTVRRANQGVAQPKPEQESLLLQVHQHIAFQKHVLQAGSLPLPSKVVCLSMAVTADEVNDDEEYQGIMEDMRVEGGKYGTLANVVIPRPNPNCSPSPGVGKVFLEYADREAAARARKALNGRKLATFGGKKAFRTNCTVEVIISPISPRMVTKVLKPRSGLWNWAFYFHLPVRDITVAERSANDLDPDFASFWRGYLNNLLYL